MAKGKDKGNKGSQTGSGDKRKGASRAARGTTSASSGGKEKKEEDWWNVPGKSGRVQPQVHVEGSGEQARRERAAENKPPKGPAGGD